MYRVCGYDGGENTAYIQQQNDLYDKHKRILDPRQQLCKDLQKVLHDLLVQGNKIIVTADINDDAGEEYNNQWNTMAKELSLRNILQHKHNNKDLPRTYDRGTRCLDTILVSPNIDNKDVTKAGILPFYSITSSDHRPQYIDINMESLFEDTSMDLTKISNKRFTTKNVRKCEIYLKTLYQSFQEANIFNKVTKIKNDIQMFITKVEKSGRYIGGETQKQLDEKLLLEHRIQVLDTKRTELMIAAERKCGPAPMTGMKWYSADLKNAAKDLSDAKKQLRWLYMSDAEKEEIENAKSIRDEAIQILRIIQKNSRQYRDEMLQDLAKKKSLPWRMTYESALKVIQEAEKHSDIYTKINITVKKQIK